MTTVTKPVERELMVWSDVDNPTEVEGRDAAGNWRNWPIQHVAFESVRTNDARSAEISLIERVKTLYPTAKGIVIRPTGVMLGHLHQYVECYMARVVTWGD